jgi:hypothetical protein
MMSHAGSWRAACLFRNWISILHCGALSVARGVTDPGVGSGALLGVFFGRTSLVVFNDLDETLHSAEVISHGSSSPQDLGRCRRNDDHRETDTATKHENRGME